MMKEVGKVALAIFHAPRLFLERVGRVEPGHCEICHEPLQDLSAGRCDDCYLDMQI
ncbi:hypothetical protein [Croceibacterium ferulae]|uniref:hypothetical protein n=1 Tax=Croceibacterium ferulae TaxID=1854641 RepID=UPI0012D7364B|nr:hypothetical protein [Croceibacterium ferulae]